jgi:hypothetical protein
MIPGQPGSPQNLPELARVLTPVSRPNPFLIAWRWRYELALAAGLSTAPVFLAHAVGWATAVSIAGSLTASVAIVPEARRWVLGHLRAIVVAHRVRTGCAQSWVHNRSGRLPLLLFCRPIPLGVRACLWCRAGTSAEDFCRATPMLTSACWASDLRIHQHERYAQIVVLDIIYY